MGKNDKFRWTGFKKKSTYIFVPPIKHTVKVRTKFLRCHLTCKCGHECCRYQSISNKLLQWAIFLEQNMTFGLVWVIWVLNREFMSFFVLIINHCTARRYILHKYETRFECKLKYDALLHWICWLNGRCFMIKIQSKTRLWFFYLWLQSLKATNDLGLICF